MLRKGRTVTCRKVPRPRHDDDELEAVLRSAETQHWKVQKGRKYYKMHCSCPRKCKKMVHLTPKRNYTRNLIGELKRSTCWEEQ